MQDKQEVARHERAQQRKSPEGSQQGIQVPFQGISEARRSHGNRAHPQCAGCRWPLQHGCGSPWLWASHTPTSGQGLLEKPKVALGMGQESPSPPCSPGREAQLAWGCHQFSCWFRRGHPVWEFALGTRHPRRREFDYLSLSDEAQSGEETGSWLGRAGFEPGACRFPKPMPRATVFHSCAVTSSTSYWGPVAQGYDVSDTTSHLPGCLSGVA